MSMALKEAKSGLGLTYPNPPVGCVIVCDGKVVSSARTGNNGRPHAEEQAMKYLTPAILSKSIMYTTLEPCCHRNINAPTCVNQIISSKIPKIVIGTIDPNPKINHQSIDLLHKANIEVITGVLEQECEDIISGFRSRILKNRPYITIKIAMSLDGKIALQNGQSKWITSSTLRKCGQKLRAENDAIMTGVGTLIRDNPMLTVRLENYMQKPLRIILDSNLQINENMRICKNVDTVRTVVFHHKKNIKKLKNIEYFYVEKDQYGLNLTLILKKISEIGINNLLVEAGQKIITSFIKQRLVDKIVVFSDDKILGDDALSAVGSLSIKELKSAPQFKTVVIRS